MLALQKLAGSALQDVEDIAEWRKRVLRYLRWREARDDNESASMRTNFLGISLFEINRDLKFFKPSEVVSHRKLRGLRSAIRLSYDKAGQTYVTLRSSLETPVPTSSPGSDGFLPSQLRKRIVGTILSFLEPSCRARCFKTIRQSFENIERLSPSSRPLAAKGGAFIARRIAHSALESLPSSVALETPQVEETKALLTSRVVSCASSKPNRWWENWHSSSVPVGHTAVSWGGAKSRVYL